MNQVNVEISANVEGYVQGIDQATQSAEKYTTETRKVADAQVNLMKELKAAKKEVQNLALGYARLDSEAKKSAFGQEMARQLEEAKEKAAELIDLQGDLQTELRNMASDTQNLDALSQGMGVFMNTTSAALGVVAQFTGNEEDAQRAIVAFTTAQSTLNAITQISNALQKQSALMLGIQRVQTLAAAAAARVKAAAEGQGVVATKAATVAQAAFNAVAMANPYVLLAMAVVGVVSALAVFCSGTDDATDEQKKLEEQMEETKKKAEEQRNTFLGAAAAHHSDAERLWELYRSYKTSNSEIEKTAILEDAANMFKKLGMEVNGTADAEKILTEQIATVTQLMKLQGDAAGVAALRMEKFKQSMAAMMEEGYSAHAASSLAGAAVADLDKELDRINGEIAARKKELKITSNAFKNSTKTTTKGGNNTNKIDYDKGSLEDLRHQLSDIQNRLKKKNQLKIDVDQAKSRITELTRQIEEKEIELGFKEPDPKDVPFTEAWYNEEIRKIENKKAMLPVDAYVQRDQLQQQIDGLKGKLKLELEGIVVVGSQSRADAWAGKTEKSISSISDAISALQKKLQDTDWSTMGQTDESGRTTKTFDEYISKIQELKAELKTLQETYDESLLTPQEKAIKHFEEVKEKADETSKTFSSLSSVAGAVGDMFKAMGDDTTAAMMQVVTATLDMIAQVIPQIMALIGAKQAEAMASGTASAAKLPYPANLGAIASIIATVLGTFASIWSAIKGAEGHADGGIVGGGSYSGDKILTRLNAGEMVLNQRQQRNLFSLLDNGLMPQKGGANITVTGVVRGSDLLLVQKNTTKIMKKRGTSINF